MNLSISCTKLACCIAHFSQNWEVLTQDQWILQTVGGYQLDLLRTPHQYQVPNMIKSTRENSSLVTLEVTGLLSKGAIVETQLTPHSFVSQIFLVEKKDGGQRPVINLKGLNQFVRVEHFKIEGLHLLPDLLQSGDWMVKMDLKDAYLQVPINPCHQPLLSFQWEEKYYMFTCLPFGLSAAPRVFTKLLKPVVGLLRQVGCRLIIYLDDLLILHQHKDRLQQMVQLISQLFSSLGLMVNHKKSILVPTQILEFLGFNINSQSTQISLPQEKMRKNPAGLQSIAGSAVSISSTDSPVCGQDNSYPSGPTNSSSALQSTAIFDELSCSSQLYSGRDSRQVQHHSTAGPREQNRSGMVELTRQEGYINPCCTTSAISDHRVRCIQQGLGCCTKGTHPDRWSLDSRGSNTSHQLSGTVSSLSCDQGLWEGLERHSSPTSYGQHNSSLVCQSQGRYNLSSAVQFSNQDVDLVHFSEHHFDSRTPPRPPQCDGRPRIAANQGSLQLDAQSPGVPEDSGEHGVAGDRSVCLSPDKATATLLQLEGGPRGSSHRCIHAGLEPPERFCEPTLVPDQSLPLQGESRGSANSASNTSVEYTTLVSSSTGNVGGLPSTADQSIIFGRIASGSGVSLETGSSSTDRLAHPRQSYSSQGLSSEASDLMLASWRDKTNSNYGSSFSKWAGWCQRRVRNPHSGPVADVVNFLAGLFSQGYQYQSLNCYRSAISSVHEKVDGNSIGVHPAVTRLLQGAFYSRPPQPRYSSFWDVGTVISYLQSLGDNDSLNLRHLTLKTVMLLALTRPSRSADLAKLDIQ